MSKTKEEILHDKFGDNIDHLLPPFPAVKKAMDEYSTQQLSEFKENLKKDYQSALNDYVKMRDGYKDDTQGYAAYDLIVREYTKLIDSLNHNRHELP